VVAIALTFTAAKSKEATHDTEPQTAPCHTPYGRGAAGGVTGAGADGTGVTDGQRSREHEYQSN
jgi:hypothetical protein